MYSLPPVAESNGSSVPVILLTIDIPLPGEGRGVLTELDCAKLFEPVTKMSVQVKSPAMPVKTDRKDARGIAQLLRMGWYRPVHAKATDAQAVRALLVGRKLLQAKLLDVELSIRRILRGYSRLVRLKRQMHGRGKLDLLQARLIGAT